MSILKQRKMEKVAAIFDALVAKENESLVEYGLQPIKDAFTKVEGNRVTFYFDGDAYDYYGHGDGYEYAERQIVKAQAAVGEIDGSLFVEYGCNVSWTVYFHSN